MTEGCGCSNGCKNCKDWVDKDPVEEAMKAFSKDDLIERFDYYLKTEGIEEGIEHFYKHLRELLAYELREFGV